MRRVILALLAGQLSAASVTFNRDIAPIMFRSCAPCHRAGDSAPFPLLTYEDARRHASQIAAVTQKRYMPPWLPAQGEFAGDRRLSEREIKLISDWVSQGEEEGATADLPAQPSFSEGWQLGPPDMVIEVPQAYKVPAGGGDVFRNLVFSLRLKELKYVRAFELRPGDKRVVHHANLFIDHRGTLRKRDGEDGSPGFPGMDIAEEARSDSFDPDSHFLFWKPGTVIQSEPKDMSWRLEPGADLILNLHVQPSGKEEMIRPELGLYFASEPPRHVPMLLQLENDGQIDIPRGAAHFEVRDELKLPLAVQVLAIYPHAHYLGKEIEAWATLPDGSRRTLIRIPDWDINWQAVYRYREPVSLPKGTTVSMRISYDNSAANARNPNVPPAEVRAGPRSRDEMGHVWLQVLPKQEGEEDPRIELQEAVMERRLEKYPEDYRARCNLGELATLRKDYPQAMALFSEASRVQPGSATARNGLGASLLAQGRVDEALVQLNEAVRLDPDHLNARWNLAHALIAKRDLAGAAREMEVFVKRQPENADGQAGLGGLYFLLRKSDEALPHLQAAARLRPQDPDIRTNLGALLASRGQFERAIREFEQALVLNPKDTEAQRYLAQARKEMATAESRR